jgi:hypothetical protein
MQRALVKYWGVGALLALFGCPRPFVLWYQEDAEMGRPSFGLSKHRGDSTLVDVHSFIVQECYRPETDSDRVHWAIERIARGGSSKLNGLVYGVVPPGFRETHPAAALAPSSCFIARARQSPDEWGESVYLLTTTTGQVTAARGDGIGHLAPPNALAREAPLDTRQTVVAVPLAAVRPAVIEVLNAWGFRAAAPAASVGLIESGVTLLDHTWHGRQIDEWVDCGMWPEGWNRVLLPISSDENAEIGWGRLRGQVAVTVDSTDNGSAITVNSRVILDPPYYQQGDRESLDCFFTDDFMRSFLAQISAATAH